jgi:hypothetical protein
MLQVSRAVVGLLMVAIQLVESTNWKDTEPELYHFVRDRLDDCAYRLRLRRD